MKINMFKIGQFGERRFIFFDVFAGLPSSEERAKESTVYQTIEEFRLDAGDRLIREVYLDATKLYNLRSEQEKGIDTGTEEQKIKQKYKSHPTYKRCAEVLDMLTKFDEMNGDFEATKQIPVIQNIITGLHDFEGRVEKEDFIALIDMLGVETLSLNQTTKQKQIRELVRFLIEKILKSNDGEPYLIDLVNSLEISKRENFLAMLKFYDMMPERLVSDIIASADDIQNKDDFRNKVHEKSKQIMQKISQIPNFNILLKDFERVFVEGKGNKKEAEAIIARLYAFQIDTETMMGYIYTEKNEQVDQGLLKKSRTIGKLELSLSIFDTVVVSQKGEIGGILTQALSSAENLNNDLGIQVFKHLKEYFEAHQASFDGNNLNYIKNYVEAYLQMPKTFDSIEQIFLMSKRANSNPFENVFYKGKNLPQTLFDLNAQINLFKAIGVQTDFVANLYDKVSRLQVGYQEVKNALNNLSNPTLAEVEQILKDKEYGAYFNALLLRANLNLQKLSPEERAKTIKEFLTLRINIGDLGLAIMSGRREVVSGLNDIENVLVQNECVKKYESIVQYLRKADKGDGNFQYNSEKMRQDLQDLRNLSEKVGLYELKQEIDSILIQNLFVNQGDNLKNLKEILRKYKGEINSLRKDAEKISAANTYDQLSQLSLSMDPNDIVAFNMALNDIMNNKDISEAEKIQKFAELVKQYKQKYKVGVRMSYETGADLGQDTVFKCRNKLMKYCTLSGLVNMLVGYAGITTVAVNAIASISSLVSSGIIGKDWDTAYKTVSSNMMYLGGGFGLAKYAKDRFNRDLDEPTWFYGTEGVKMAKWLDRDFDKRKKGENLNVSEGQQIGLMILGRRKFRDNDKGILMNTKLIRAVSKAEDNAKNIVSFEQLNDWYKKTADGQEDSNDLTKEEMIRFLELSYSKEELDWSEVLENNSEDGKAKEKEIVQTIINLVNYGRYPSRWSTERLSKTANACMKFLPKDKKEEFGVR